mgnify:CR=1 FL=1
MGFKLRSGNKPSFKNMGTAIAKGATAAVTGAVIGGAMKIKNKKSTSPNKHSHAKSSDYWYKIGNKKVTKEEYNKYKNEPGSDKPTKTTNDPDASGRKAAIEKARSKNKASKRATVLTKAQTKAKEKDLGPITKKRAEEIAIKKHRENWSPAFPGADHSQEELDKMTEKEKQDYWKVRV